MYVYCACARYATYARLGAPPLRIADRFTGGAHELDGAELADFALLTIANEVDVARAGRLAPAAVEGIRTLVRALGRYSPEAGRRALAELSPP